MNFKTRFARPKNPSIDFSACEKLVAVEFAREADINFLLNRYKNTGSLYTADQMMKAKARPRFGDFTGIPDFQDSLDKMREALAMFGDLPLAVRQRFSDDPVQLLAFLSDEKNRDEAYKLGLVESPDFGPKPEPQPEPQPDKVVVASDESAKPPATVHQ